MGREKNLCLGQSFSFVTMNKRILFILMPAIALAFGATLLIEKTPVVETPATHSASVSVTETISLTAGAETYTLPLDMETTVVEVMARLSASQPFTYRTKEFPGLGAFVDEINGKRNADGYYWILRINGKKSDLGISQAVVHPGDAIEWRYEKSY
jgi:hypothetical protein